MIGRQDTSKELPKGWASTTLGDIAEFKNGINFTKDQKGDKGIPTVDVLNMYPKGIYIESQNLYRVDVDPHEDHILRNRDILFVRSSVKREGVGWSCIFRETKEPVTYCGFTIRARIESEEILPEFLIYFLRSDSAREKTIGSSSQVTITNISQSALGKTVIPLPPYKEQHRIVSKIEELFTRLDAGVDELEKAQSKLSRYRHAILKHGLEGRLTEEWRGVHRTESPSEREVAANVTTNGVSHPDQNSPFSLPLGWQWIRLSAVSERVQIGPFGTQLHKKDYVSDGIPIINPSHIKNGLIVPDRELTVAEKKYKELVNYILQEGDVIVGRRGEMGRCAMISEKESGWICGTGSLFVRPTQRINQNFLCWTLGSERVKSFLETESLGTTMNNLNLQIVNSIPIPLPPLSEQEMIVQEIESHSSIVDKLSDTIAANIARAARLRQSILCKAFSGRLVPQDPNDEAAEKLLERITESASRAVQSRRKRKSNGDAPNGK